jgi:hypothetical protein
MQRNWMVASIVALALVLPVAARAHEGHLHNVLGTITGVQGEEVAIKTAAGKPLTVVLSTKTTVTRGKERLDATALKIGERVSVAYLEQNKVMTAQAIKLGTVAAARK